MFTAKKMQEYLFSIPAFSPISYFLLFITVTARNSATSTAHAVKNAYPNHNGVTHPITAITLEINNTMRLIFSYPFGTTCLQSTQINTYSKIYIISLSILTSPFLLSFSFYCICSFTFTMRSTDSSMRSSEIVPSCTA